MDVASLTPALPEGTHLVNQSDAYTSVGMNANGERGWFTQRAFKKGEVVEVNGLLGGLAGVEQEWRRIHISRIGNLSPEHRALFNHWAINMDIDGTYAFPTNERFAIQNASNFCNHSCDPNLWYAEDSNALIARRDIHRGIEILSVPFLNYMIRRQVYMASL